jgi:hypothetical protein
MVYLQSWCVVRLLRCLLFMCIFSRIEIENRNIEHGRQVMYVPSSEAKHPGSDTSSQSLHTCNRNMCTSERIANLGFLRWR